MKRLFQAKSASVPLAIFCTLLWGTAFPFIKLGYAAFDVAENDVGAMLLFAGCRFFLAGLMVLPVLAFGRNTLLPKKGDYLPIAVLGLVMTGAQYFFTYIGLGYTSGANTSIITACASFFTVFGAAIFFRGDRLTVLKILGCIVGTTATLLGDGLILVSTVCSAAGNLLSKKIAAGRNPLLVTACQLIFGGALLIIAGLCFGGRLDFSKLTGVMILVWLAFVSAAAFSIWTALLKYHSASRISVFTLLIPVFGTALSGLLLGESVFRIETILALLLIAAGIVMVNLSGKRRQKT